MTEGTPIDTTVQPLADQFATVIEGVVAALLKPEPVHHSYEFRPIGQPIHMPVDYITGTAGRLEWGPGWEVHRESVAGYELIYAHKTERPEVEFCIDEFEETGNLKNRTIFRANNESVLKLYRHKGSESDYSYRDLDNAETVALINVMSDPQEHIEYLHALTTLSPQEVGMPAETLPTFEKIEREYADRLAVIREAERAALEDFHYRLG